MVRTRFQLSSFFSGPFLIVTAASLWALDGLIRRSLFSRLNPPMLVFLEHCVGALILVPFLIRQFRAQKYTKHVWGLISIISVLSGLLGTLWFTSALAASAYMPLSVVFLIQKLQPLCAIGTASVVLAERIKPRFGIWAVVALIAAYFVTFPLGRVNWQTGSGTIYAAVLALGAAAAWGTSTALSRKLVLSIPVIEATGWRFVITSLCAGVYVAVGGYAAAGVSIDWFVLSRLLIIALSTGMVALWIYYWGLSRTKASVATILELVYPLLAVVIDMVYFQTFLHPAQYIAGIVLLGAMYQVSRDAAPDHQEEGHVHAH